jgi:hypothetical protein
MIGDALYFPGRTTVHPPPRPVQGPEVSLLCRSIGEVTNTTGHAALFTHGRATDPLAAPGSLSAPPDG